MQNKDGKKEKKTEQILGHRQILKEDVTFIQEQAAKPAGMKVEQLAVGFNEPPEQAK